MITAPSAPAVDPLADWLVPFRAPEDPPPYGRPVRPSLEVGTDTAIPESCEPPPKLARTVMPVMRLPLPPSSPGMLMSPPVAVPPFPPELAFSPEPAGPPVPAFPPPAVKCVPTHESPPSLPSKFPALEPDPPVPTVTVSEDDSSDSRIHFSQ